MFTRLAKYIDKIISYPNSLLSAAFMVAMVFVMLGVTAEVSMRALSRAFDFSLPVLGIWDLCGLAFSIIVWGGMAAAALKGSHVAIDFLKDKLPRLPRLSLELIIALVNAGILAIVSWRLVLHGIQLGAYKTETAVLKIPYEPFVYFAAFACALTALAFLARVPEAVGKIRKEPETAEKIQQKQEAVGKVEKMKGSSV